MDAHEIETRIGELLAERGVAMAVEHWSRGKRDGWDCDGWKITFTKIGIGPLAGDSATFDFYTGSGHRSPGRVPGYKVGEEPPRRTDDWIKFQNSRKSVAPNAASVLHSLVSDADAIGQSFNNWADDFGYDTDSRKALETFLACQENGVKLRRIIGDLTSFREALEDY